ncbi:MAG: Nif3-like dinuclear metal center hexameric protein [Nanoarchaeota archaeon]
MAETRRIVDYCDDLLNTEAIKDLSQNGLQVQGLSEVKTACFAVDASLESITQSPGQILFVHHGLFWRKPLLLTGSHFQRIKACIRKDLALYASHLPLDAHQVLGNNAQLARLLSTTSVEPFGEYHGMQIGMKAKLRPLPLKALIDMLNRKLHTRCVVAAYGKQTIRSVGIVSGDGCFALEEAKDLGLDALITGETKHQYMPLAKELDMNVLFAGHYATETLGLKALAKHLEKRFNITTRFVDLPTGL